MAVPPTKLYTAYEAEDTQGNPQGGVAAFVTLWPPTDGSTTAMPPPGQTAQNPLYVSSVGGSSSVMGTVAQGAPGTLAWLVSATGTVSLAGTSQVAGTLAVSNTPNVRPYGIYMATQPTLGNGGEQEFQLDNLGNLRVVQQGTAAVADATLAGLLGNSTGSTTLAMGTVGTQTVITNASNNTLRVAISGLTAAGGSISFLTSNTATSALYAVGAFNGAANTRLTAAAADGSYTFDIGARAKIVFQVATVGSGTVTLAWTQSPGDSLVTVDSSPAGPLHASPVVNGADVSPANPLPVSATGTVSAPTVAYTTPAASSIGTAGVAVTALAAGTILHGFDLRNPPAATEPLYFNLTATAGTVASGANFILQPGEAYHGAFGTAQALSVNAASAGHTFMAFAY